MNQTEFLFDELIMYSKIVSLSDLEKAKALFEEGKRYILSISYPYYKEAYILGLRTPEFLEEFEKSIVASIDQRTKERNVTITKENLNDDEYFVASIGYFSGTYRERELSSTLTKWRNNPKEWEEMMGIAMKEFPNNPIFLLTKADDLLQQTKTDNDVEKARIIDEALGYYQRASQEQSDDFDILRLKQYFALTVFFRASWLVSAEMALDIYLIASALPPQDTHPLQKMLPDKDCFYWDLSYINGTVIYKSCVRVGNNCLHQKKYQQAIPFFEKARQLCSDRRIWIKARDLNNLGKAFHGIADQSKAMECFLESLRLQEEEKQTELGGYLETILCVISVDPNNDEIGKKLAKLNPRWMSCIKIGDAYFDVKYFDKALFYYEKGATMNEADLAYFKKYYEADLLRKTEFAKTELAR